MLKAIAIKLTHLITLVHGGSNSLSTDYVHWVLPIGRQLTQEHPLQISQLFLTRGHTYTRSFDFFNKFLASQFLQSCTQ